MQDQNKIIGRRKKSAMEKDTLWDARGCGLVDGK